MFTLEQVVPWGRSFDEYVRMFALDELVGEPDLRQVKILGCADGPASFNAEATRRGLHVVSADPLYRLTAGEIRERIAASYDQVIEQTKRNAHQFVWDVIRSVEELGRLRMQAMQAFLDDFAAGKSAGRYVDAELPSLPFPDQSFDVALCSHFLFLYTEHLPESFHSDAVRELCRVAREVRIFPLLALDGRRSPHVAAIVDALRDVAEVTLERVSYEFQRGGNEMMRVRRLAPT